MASKAIYSMVAVVGIAAASGAAWWYQQPKSVASHSTEQTGSSPRGAASGGAAGKPVAVEMALVELAQLSDDARAVGSLRSRRGVIIRPEVAGRISQLNFTDGQRVRKGQVLVQLDDQLQQAQIQQSRAELSIAQANQKRNQELVAQNFVSQRSLDESAASLQVAQAKLSLSNATAARLKIIAPFDGIAGIRLVNVGDYLKDGADIVNIEDIDAMFVDFRLPERFQSKIQRGQTAQLDIDALPGQTYRAQIQAIDPLIDANGRSVGIRGCIDNRRMQLRPGMFARVNTVFGMRDDARVVPEEALLPQGGKQFVIKLLPGSSEQTRTTQRVEVKTGLRTPGRVEILQGLEPGEAVVTAGQQRITRDGTVVSVSSRSASRATGPQAKASVPASSASASGTASIPSPTSPVSLSSVASAPLAGPNPCGSVLAEARPVVKVKP